MGTQSFGKGSVQTIITIKGHGAVRLTTALYYTPSGRSIQKDGVTPDIVVPAPKDEQVANSLVWREGQLSGAFANPGPLDKSKSESNAKPASVQPASPPIQEQLIEQVETRSLRLRSTIWNGRTTKFRSRRHG